MIINADEHAYRLQAARTLAPSQGCHPAGGSLRCIDANRIENEIVAHLHLERSPLDRYYTLSRCFVLKELVVREMGLGVAFD